jgi:2-polyprenyl-6-methoxyphenol hydroxylase-like FAD-dependent oxidoreductase
MAAGSASGTPGGTAAPAGPIELHSIDHVPPSERHADLVIAADGRGSLIRESLGLTRSSKTRSPAIRGTR